MEVIIRATKQLDTIEDDAYDASLHIKVEVNDENEPITRSQFQEGLKDVATEIGKALLERESQKPAGKVDRSNQVGLESREEGTDDERKPAFEGARIKPGWARKYDLITDPALKAVKSWEGDWCVREWLLAKMERSDGRVQMWLDRADEVAGVRADLGTGDTGTGSGSAALGGNRVPIPLSSEIDILQQKRERLAPNSGGITTNMQKYQLNQEATVVVATGQAENSTTTADDTTTQTVDLVKQRASVLVLSSRELLKYEDAAYSIASDVAAQAAKAFAIFFDTQGAVTGDGVRPNHLLSIVGATISQQATVTTNTLDKQVLIDLFHAIASEWRENTTMWYLADSAQITLMAALDDGFGRSLFQGIHERSMQFGDAGPPNGTVGVMLGLPVMELPFGDDIIRCGSLENGMFVFQEGGIEMDVTTEGGATFADYQVGWHFHAFRDSSVRRTQALSETDTTVTV